MRFRKQRTKEERVDLQKRQLRYAIINLAVEIGVPKTQEYLALMSSGMLRDPIVHDIIRDMMDAKDIDDG